MTRSPKPRKPTRKALTIVRDLEINMHLLYLRPAWLRYASCRGLLRELRRSLKQTKAR